VSDPLRMFLVLRRGAVETLERAAVLGGAAAVACVREFEIDPEWRERPGKVCLRARNPAQWAAVLEEPHALAGDAEGESVAALPPRRRSERGPLLERLQAMSSDLGPAPAELRDGDGVAYVLNPELDMSSGKVVAQVAHAAVMAAEALPEWAAAGAPGRLVSPLRGFAELCARDDLAARVVDAGLTEVAPGTVTVLALPPRG
jgi:peptidyl-tRNA hydrolase PTH2